MLQELSSESDTDPEAAAAVSVAAVAKAVVAITNWPLEVYTPVAVGVSDFDLNKPCAAAANYRNWRRVTGTRYSIIRLVRFRGCELRHMAYWIDRIMLPRPRVRTEGRPKWVVWIYSVATWIDSINRVVITIKE